jgi:hypothetical protein
MTDKAKGDDQSPGMLLEDIRSVFATKGARVFG